MDLATILPWLQLTVSAILIVLVLLQSGNEGGLGGAFGGGSDGGAFHTRRGLERTLFIGTIFVGITFGVLAVISLFITS